MRPGSVRDHDSTDNLHQMQKRLTKRVTTLEAGGSEVDGSQGQAFMAAMNRIEAASKSRDEALRDQIKSLRGRMMALGNEVKRLKGADDVAV